MGDGMVRDKRYDDVDKSRFLTAMGLVAERHGISWDDIDINFGTGAINIKTDLKPEAILSFLTDVQAEAGDFD